MHTSDIDARHLRRSSAACMPPLERSLGPVVCSSFKDGYQLSVSFHGQVGRLWTALADYFIRQGMFEKARDVYEEGLTTVITVRDFSLIFDALTTFETSLLEARLAVSYTQLYWPAMVCIATLQCRCCTLALMIATR